MNSGCLTPEELIEVVHGPADDPRRRHLETCAACRALQASLELFDAPDGLPSAADPADADARLEAMIRREIGGRPSAAARPARREPARRSRWWLAAAAVAVVALGLVAWRAAGPPDQPRITLRGRGELVETTLRLAAPERRPDGGIALTWNAFAEADAYAVVLRDGDREEVVRIAAGPRLARVLGPDDLAPLAGRPRPLTAAVVALRDGEEIARSLPRVLPEAE